MWFTRRDRIRRLLVRRDMRNTFAADMMGEYSRRL